MKSSLHFSLKQIAFYEVIIYSDLCHAPAGSSRSKDVMFIASHLLSTVLKTLSYYLKTSSAKISRSLSLFTKCEN